MCNAGGGAHFARARPGPAPLNLFAGDPALIMGPPDGDGHGAAFPRTNGGKSRAAGGSIRTSPAAPGDRSRTDRA